MGQPGASLDPHETLCVPKKRRFVHEYVSTEDGGRELRIYFGLKEISFDEAEFIPFGEQLIKQDRFLAGSATGWSGGEPYPWERVKEMLEQLLEEGVIERGESEAQGGRSALQLAFVASEAAREAPAEPLFWRPDCASVMQKLTGRPLELGYLETVIPVHRVVHAALDADGRHVGEINVFPDVMRMKVPTEWRPCNYPGSRYQDDLPMNVTALQAMAKLWRPVLEAALAVRAEFVRRYPLAADGRWKLGDLHAFACAALALPTLAMMRERDPVENTKLDPVLSSMFRLIDGVRIVTIYLLFLPEQPRTYDAPMTGPELLYLTERENHFLSTRGVCAGPPPMIEEFFAAVVDGQAPTKGSAPLGAWASEIPAAIDYGLYGIQLYSVIFTLWARMGWAYQRVREALRADAALAEPGLEGLRARIEADWAVIVPGRLNQAAQRNWSEARYEEMYQQAQRGVRGHEGREPARLGDALTPPAGLLDEGARAQLRAIFAGQTGGAERAALEGVADAVLDYLRSERMALTAAAAVQRQINALLGRAHPTRPLAGADLALHHRFRVQTLGGLPVLMDAFEAELGLSVENTETATRVTRGGATVELT
ncbi:MAG: hypothetical protein MUF34_02670 [Polyangiaceae bacterium]|nr:hypothetical protein [Polyangiaceae bacterium]